MAVGPERVAITPVDPMNCKLLRLQLLDQFTLRVLVKKSRSPQQLLLLMLEMHSQPQPVIPHVVVLGVYLQQILQKLPFPQVVRLRSGNICRELQEQLLLVRPQLILLPVSAQQTVHESNLPPKRLLLEGLFLKISFTQHQGVVVRRTDLQHVGRQQKTTSRYLLTIQHLTKVTVILRLYFRNQLHCGFGTVR
jgi:hypothetical protein